MSLITRVKTNRLAYDAIRRAPWLYGNLKARLATLEQASLEERRTFTEEHFDRLLRHAWFNGRGRSSIRSACVRTSVNSLVLHAG